MLKLIRTLSDGPVVCRVYRDEEWDEYRVRILRDGKLLPAQDYHTTCEQDAMGTAALMLAQAVAKSVKTVA